MTKKIPYLFLLLAIAALLIGICFGSIGAMQYLLPDFIKEYFDFSKTRPLHVSSVVSWILLSATAVIYHYLNDLPGMSRLTSKLSVFHFFIFLLTGVLVLGFLSAGIFGGREYMAFPPALSIPIWLGWALFAIGFFTAVIRIKGWHVYLWMWATGIVFLIFTFTEAHLWLIPYFRDNIIRDITVQWKSYGSLVGSWNMLVYGTAIYVMYHIHKDEKLVRGFLPFFLFFLGFINLLFGWGHHTYIVPSQPWIRHIAYFISMTELVVIGIMIWKWRASLSEAKKHLHSASYRLLYSADYWIALNLILAIIISIPSINFFTHGTYITVAHAMGTTIGINTTILLAAVFYLLMAKHPTAFQKKERQIKIGFYVFHFSLLAFWICLILGGLVKSNWMYSGEFTLFSEMQTAIRPYFIVFLISGLGISTGLLLILLPPLKTLLKLLRS